MVDYISGFREQLRMKWNSKLVQHAFNVCVWMIKLHVIVLYRFYIDWTHLNFFYFYLTIPELSKPRLR